MTTTVFMLIERKLIKQLRFLISHDFLVKVVTHSIKICHEKS